VHITIEKTVSYEVSKVVIQNVMIHKSRNGLVFMIPFSWLDAQGKSIKMSSKVFNSTELAQLASGLGMDLVPFIAMFNGILSNDKLSIRLDLKDQANIKGMVAGRGEDGKFYSVELKGESLNTAISPFTQQNIVDIIQAISVQLTA
jgi:hypothetical protein